MIKYDNFVDIIENLIQGYNIIFRNNLGFHFELKHWKKNVYLGRGKPRVQDRINLRLVESCDIFIGLLWMRFGSPPGINLEGKNYESGTEEEFYLARDSSKEIWLFFYDCPINPSKINPDQLKKIRKFKESIRNKQIEYSEFSSKEDFRRQFNSHISEWIRDKYSIKKALREKEIVKKDLPKKEDFEMYNRGF